MATKGPVFVCLLWSAVLLFSLLTTSATGEIKIQRKKGYIVDIKASTSNGAKLMGGMAVQDTEACVQECAGQEVCDMSVFKLEGYSDSGKNCYLLACTGHCVTAEHNGFVSVHLDKSSQSKEDEDVKSETSDDVLKALEVIVNDVLDKDTKKTENEGKVAETEGKVDETEGKVDETEGKVDETEGKVDETEGKVDETEGKETVDDTPDAVDGSELPFNPYQSGPDESHVAAEAPKAMVDEGDAHTKDEETEQDHVNSEEEEDASVQEVLDSLDEEFANMADDNTVNIQAVDEDPNTDSGPLNIASSPNPAGVIVGVVLGGCVLVLVASTVMAVGMRKGWEAFQKRKYQKMDYLINGMYS